VGAWKGEVSVDSFGFLTTEPKAVKPVHPKAMPVILTTADEPRLAATPVR
jgi:putative SOS response-associated peptidase YedK